MMTTSQLGLYVAEAAFAGIIFTLVGAVSRAFWDYRRGR